MHVEEFGLPNPNPDLFTVDWAKGNLCQPSQDYFYIGKTDPSVYEMVVQPPIGGCDTVMLSGSKAASYVNFGFDFKDSPISSAKRCHDYDPSVRLVYWPGHDCFLASHPTDEAELEAAFDARDYSKWKLHRLTWGGQPEPMLKAQRLGDGGFNVVNFACNPAGNHIFWP